jgi:hypothetical protein
MRNPQLCRGASQPLASLKEDIAMRFSNWVRCRSSNLIGIAAKAAHYELLGPEPNEITEPAMSGGAND